jgi:hypothetical protein
MAPRMFNHRQIFMRGVSSEAKHSSNQQKEAFTSIFGSFCIHLRDKCAKSFFSAFNHEFLINIIVLFTMRLNTINKSTKKHGHLNFSYCSTFGFTSYLLDSAHP